MRHSEATVMIEAGIDIHVIQKILGHSDLSITQICATVMDNYMVREIQKFNSIYNYFILWGLYDQL